MYRLIALSIFFINIYVSAQGVSSRLGEAVNKLENDSSLKHASLSLYVVESKTGKHVFNKNSELGLAPASCQKIFTSAAAFELLGPAYRFKTSLGYTGKIESGILTGNLLLTGNGDPTLGSWRWDQTKESQVIQKFVTEIKKAGINKITGRILKDEKNWGSSVIPDGWIWQDIGNYYGAGASSINWRENQYDVILKPGDKIGDTVTIVSFNPVDAHLNLICEVKTAAKGTGDNAYIYLPPDATTGYIRGTIPIGEKSFSISGASPHPFLNLINSFAGALNNAGVNISTQDGGANYEPLAVINPIFTYLSPSLDSINYWFLKKSINLYGEALLKTMALEKEGFGSEEKGVKLLKFFWSQRGIENSALNIMDGCGLSPQNRVTTDALVKAMLYARSRPWFEKFYRALPEINGISMKSGSINGARSYTGYIKSKNGTEYTFAIIVNNFDGPASAVVRKVWEVLNVLK